MVSGLSSVAGIIGAGSGSKFNDEVLEHACNSMASVTAQKGKALIDQFLWLKIYS
ncbi:hypothetical protein SX4_1343 [Vibrio mimicus SX-4]|nr:hypothetical protein SX4_1343 [Vibrio mimicus SX-4]